MEWISVYYDPKVEMNTAFITTDTILASPNKDNDKSLHTHYIYMFTSRWMMKKIQTKMNQLFLKQTKSKVTKVTSIFLG